ncbi:CRISPR-associated endonuclease Cas2 [candidate division WOR-3 bacterium]|nr:CRISPR-associated endonuclease Cas2 [candidate division WOR-3 bacterium]
MAEQKLWYLVAYDVRDPKRLRCVAEHLKGYGVRLQYSLFRCRLYKREVERLRWELMQMTTEDDDILIIGLCERCAAKIRQRKVDPEWNKEVKRFEII